MTQIQITNNLTRLPVEIVNEETVTPKELLVKAGVNFGTATISLDGSVLSSKEMNSPLKELGVTADSMSYLAAVVKATNA